MRARTQSRPGKPGRNGAHAGRGDVVVCGAGAAGMAAALAAARQGARVCLVEARRRIGGTVTHALIHTLGGVYGPDGELINDGLPAELVTRLIRLDPAFQPRQIGRTCVLSVCPRIYGKVVRAWIAAEPRIEILDRSRIARVTLCGDRIDELDVAGPDGLVRLRPRAVIDATGSAEVVRLIDGNLIEDDSQRAAGGLIFTMRGVAPGTLTFPRGIGVLRALRSAADEGALPLECAKVWIDAGVRQDEVYVKLFLPLTSGWRDQESWRGITRRALRIRARTISFLRRLPGFANAVPGATGRVGVRDGGRIRGEYCLTGADVRAGRRFEDAACRGCWPIEYWHPVDGVSVEYLPEGCRYEIPLRSLKVQEIRNLWAAGKCLSADRVAQASARVVGTCWAMGEAAGRAAASR